MHVAKHMPLQNTRRGASPFPSAACYKYVPAVPFAGAATSSNLGGHTRASRRAQPQHGMSPMCKERFGQPRGSCQHVEPARGSPMVRGGKGSAGRSQQGRFRNVYPVCGLADNPALLWRARSCTTNALPHHHRAALLSPAAAQPR